RCQPSSVSGRTKNDGRLVRLSSRLAAARNTRSDSCSSGRASWRRRTASSCRSTTISSSLNSRERRRSAATASARRNSRYTSEINKRSSSRSRTEAGTLRRAAPPIHTPSNPRASLRTRHAAELIEETDSLIDASGGRRIDVAKLLLAACRGNEAEAATLLPNVEREAIERREGVVLTFSEHARAVLHNGLAHYDVALAAAQQASERDEPSVSGWGLAELVEAAARSSRAEPAADALERLQKRTQAAGTEWALGLEARSRALLSDGAVAEDLYREAIDRLARCRLALELARAHLLSAACLRRPRPPPHPPPPLRPAHH